jgi:hypothetical protein
MKAVPGRASEAVGGVGSSLRQLKCYWCQRTKADAQLPCASRKSYAAGRCAGLWRKRWGGRLATRLVGEGVIQGTPPRRHGRMMGVSIDVDPLRLPLTTIPSWLLEALVARPPCTQQVWAKSRSKAFCRTWASRVCVGAAIARRPLLAAFSIRGMQGGKPSLKSLFEACTGGQLCR